MSKPDISPKTSAAGIAVDPKTLERVIPETKRPDGSVRKQLRVRPGFTPQEDVSRFRGTRQQQHDRNQLPKGHILGWIAPSSSEQRNKKGLSASESASSLGTDGGEKPTAAAAAMTKSAAKNAKRRAKKQAEKEKAIREAWDEDSEDEKEKEKAGAKTKGRPSDVATKDESPQKSEGATAVDVANETNETPAATDSRDEGDALAKELEKKLDVH
ncbi:hypothetical protein ACEPAI_6046 [Sanghuangporus weigelae]